MSKVKIVTAEGYSEKEAFESTGLNLDVKFNATTAYKNDGKPEGRHLDAFASEYIEKKVKGAAGIGFAITLETGVADSRERPYKVENIVTSGARKWKMVYQGFVNADTNGIGGTLVLSKDTKGEAEEAAKEYVSKHKVAVAVRLGKQVTGSVGKDGKPGAAQDVAMIVHYTPSINTTKGKYVFFGIEAE